MKWKHGRFLKVERTNMSAAFHARDYAKAQHSNTSAKHVYIEQ